MRIFVAAALAAVVGTCPGRDAQPVAVVQPHDQTSDCTMICAEIEAYNIKVNDLARERGLKTAQNVAAGVVGVFVWPVFFAMDTKGAADTEIASLQSRQQYLSKLAEQRCVAPKPPAGQARR
jgi:hypothetical protein